jgi:gluconolactonase
VTVEVKRPAMSELVEADTELEQLGSGFSFTEGPVWVADGYLLFSDMPGDVRRRWDEQAGVQEVSRPSHKGNGMALDPQGRLLVCEHATSSVVRMNASGDGSDRQVIASHYEGKELNSPNDIVVSRGGHIYFTDPTYGRMAGFGIERDQELAFQGLYRVGDAPDRPELLFVDFGQPNGLCFSPDEKLLYVNDTDRTQIEVFNVGADGSLDGRAVFRDGIGTASMETGDLVDGMKCDEHGNVWVTGPGGVLVFSPSAEHLGTIRVPEPVGNLSWGGPDFTWLFIVASTSLYRLRCRVAGKRAI